MALTVSSARAATRSAHNTLAPSRANRIAAALPLPMPAPRDPAPVTIATLPANRPVTAILLVNSTSYAAYARLHAAKGKSNQRSCVDMPGDAAKLHRLERTFPVSSNPSMAWLQLSVPVRALFVRHLFARHLFSRHLFSRHLFSRHLFSRHLFSRHLPPMIADRHGGVISARGVRRGRPVFSWSRRLIGPMLSRGLIESSLFNPLGGAGSSVPASGAGPGYPLRNRRVAEC